MMSGPADPKSSQAQPSWVVGPPVAPASRLGQLIDGEFLIKSILGQGELGVTYEADNTRHKRRFAVLMLSRGLKPTHAMMLAVRDDLRHGQQLSAAGLMPVKAIADRDGIPGFATELVDGETLRSRLGRGPLRVERALAIALSLARTLEAAHKVGLIHGDLRPENIFLVRPEAKSAFAGKVMVVEHAMHHLRRRTPGLDDRLPLYKLMYRPPEQVLGEAGASEQGDVWVLGAILYECLTGKPAFYAEEPEFVLDNLGQAPPPLQPNAATGLSAELAAAFNLLIASSSARALESRVANMTELREGIEQLVRGARLFLPEVLVESHKEAATSAQPASTSNRRMNQLLQRLSGVFPQIPLVGSGTSSTTDATAAPPATQGQASTQASDRPTTQPKLVPLEPITPAKERVNRILSRLSGAYPTTDATPQTRPPIADAPLAGLFADSALLPNPPVDPAAPSPPAQPNSPAVPAAPNVPSAPAAPAEPAEASPPAPPAAPTPPALPEALAAVDTPTLPPRVLPISQPLQTVAPDSVPLSEQLTRPAIIPLSQWPSPPAKADGPAAAVLLQASESEEAVADSAKPSQETPTSAKTPQLLRIEERPTRVDSTLPAALLAPLSDPALPTLHVFASLPTMPNLAEIAETIHPLGASASERLHAQATQPALQRLPINEKATQAKLDALSPTVMAPSTPTAVLPMQSAASHTSTLSAHPSLIEISTLEPLPLGNSEQKVSAEPLTPPPLPISSPLLPVPPPMPAAAAAPPAAETTEDEKQRAPRVSQLIAALQAQQMPPPAASPPDEPRRRMSPGLIAPAPDIFAPVQIMRLSSSNETQVAPAEQRGALAWVLRHQEAVAALAGALLVILGVLVYLLFHA